MGKLRHIAITVPDPWKAAEFYFGFWVDDVKASQKAIEAAGGTHWMGEPSDDGGFYEVKFHDPDGLVVDITENGWTGAAK